MAHFAHMAYTMPIAMRDDLSSGDNSDLSNDFEEDMNVTTEEDMNVTTFYHGTPLQRIWASMPGSGLVPQANEENAYNVLVEGRGSIARRTPTPGLGWSTSW